mgnify:CR=1 FL=1
MLRRAVNLQHFFCILQQTRGLQAAGGLEALAMSAIWALASRRNISLASSSASRVSLNAIAIPSLARSGSASLPGAGGASVVVTAVATSTLSERFAMSLRIDPCLI